MIKNFTFVAALYREKYVQEKGIWRKGVTSERSPMDTPLKRSRPKSSRMGPN